MIEYYNVWLAVSQTVTQAKAELTESREALKLDEAVAVSGKEPVKGEPVKTLMRAEVEAVLTKEADPAVRLFKPATVSGKQFELLSLYFRATEGDPFELAKAALDDYPDDTLLLGIWDDTGLRYGDLHPDAWRVMPDLIKYDEAGEIAATIPASSDADLRDVVVLYGQGKRDFA